MIRIGEPRLGDAEIEAAARVLRSRDLAQGPEVAAFEDEFAATVGRRPCVAVSSGTDALHLSLRALGIGPGDEVIIPSFTFVATANAVVLSGATPVFADVHTSDVCLDPDRVRSAITSRTAAVVVVHLFGNTADMDRLTSLCRSKGLALVEDACQAHGATYKGRPVGTFGAAAAFSLYATKNVTTGEGGMAVLRDEVAADQIRVMRNHGFSADGSYGMVGMNAKMSDLQAAIGRVQLHRLPDSLRKRRGNAQRYSSSLTGVKLPDELAERDPAWSVYTIRISEGRDRVREKLVSGGIESKVYYETPLHRSQPFLTDIELPVTEAMSREVLSLPVHPGLGPHDIDTIIEAVGDALD